MAPQLADGAPEVEHQLVLGVQDAQGVALHPESHAGKVQRVQRFLCLSLQQGGSDTQVNTGEEGKGEPPSDGSASVMQAPYTDWFMLAKRCVGIEGPSKQQLYCRNIVVQDGSQKLAREGRRIRRQGWGGGWGGRGLGEGAGGGEG